MHAFLISTHLEHVKQDDWLDSWQDQRDFLPPNDAIFDSTALTLFHMLPELWNLHSVVNWVAWICHFCCKVYELAQNLRKRETLLCVSTKFSCEIIVNRCITCLRFEVTGDVKGANGYAYWCNDLNPMKTKVKTQEKTLFPSTPIGLVGSLIRKK